MNNKKETFLNTVLLILGEIIVSLIVIGAYLLGDLLFKSDFWDFSYRIITGAALGSVVTVLNYVFLTVSVNRAVNRFLTLRGSREMTDEEASEFAAKHAMGIQNAIKTSFLVRTASIVATLVIAFILDWFAPLATIIPLLAFRPLITFIELVKRKVLGTPDPMALMNAITYSADEVDSVAREITDEDDTINNASEVAELVPAGEDTTAKSEIVADLEDIATENEVAAELPASQEAVENTASEPNSQETAKDDTYEPALEEIASEDGKKTTIPEKKESDE